MKETDLGICWEIKELATEYLNGELDLFTLISELDNYAEKLQALWMLQVDFPEIDRLTALAKRRSN